MGGILDEVRKDLAAFFDFIIEKGLATDNCKDGRIEVTGVRWSLSNIAEILSSEDVICKLVEEKNENGETINNKLCISAE